ncbi:LCP family protein [uncultured Corynebacterium sp.]|mgnify:CR=1 FL=1|uniref:LCP family protein n=1 Tax=uncultured Corynebacterium sp. TaxID=159447 RepID=UPI0025F1955F|nr:LCP family protein [uncultured Corynebacterium sp.]
MNSRDNFGSRRPANNSGGTDGAGDMEIARDRHGKPLLDRYGRPVRKGVIPPSNNASHEPEGPRYRRVEPIPPRDTNRAAHRGYQPQPAPEAAPQQDQPFGDPQFGGYSERRGRNRTGRGESPRPTRRPRGRTTPRPKRRRRFGFFKALGLLLVIVLAFSVGAAVWIDTKLQRTDALQDYDGRLGGTSGTNWLLVGSDSRAGLSKEDADRLMAGELNDSVGRTDTIMVVHIPRFGGEATMLSLPRDSWVDIPGNGKNKLNQAFSIGGPALLQQTVEQATGIHLDHYAEIGFGGFANVVDAVGGVEMCLDEPLEDPMAGINLQAGCQELDGPTALGYVRSRYTSAQGDLDRVERQRKFLAALSKKIKSPGTLLNPFKNLKVADALSANMTVNEDDHVWNLASLGLAMAGGAKQETVPIAGYEDTYAGNVALWDDAGAEEMFAKLR